MPDLTVPLMGQPLQRCGPQGCCSGAKTRRGQAACHELSLHLWPPTPGSDFMALMNKQDSKAAVV